MKILAAKPVIEKRRHDLAEQVKAYQAKTGRVPHLSVILVGEDPASKVYVANKGAAAEKVGFTHETIIFPHDVSVETLQKKVAELNASSKVDGILIQRPLPKQFKEKDVSEWVSPAKDVDCLHPENVGLLVNGTPRFNPCTPGGVMNLLDFYGISVSGKIACVIGRSSIVGKPLVALLLSCNATIIQVHRSTVNPQALCKQADLVFVAAGAKQLLKRDWIKEGAVVVDIGIHKGEDGKLVGDADVNSLGNAPSAITPVPGGVGPMTIQTLLENTFASASNRK